MGFTATRLHVVLTLTALLLCGCPNDSSRSQSANRGDTQQSDDASSNVSRKNSVKGDTEASRDAQSQTESPEDRLAQRVDELASQLASTDFSANQKTMQQLIRLGPDAAIPLWNVLEQASTDDSANARLYRGRLLIVLAQLRNGALIQPVFEKLTQPDLEQKSRPSYEAVLKNLGERSRSSIDQLAQHERAEVRESGVRLLAGFRDPEAIQTLTAALQDESSRVRVHAASSLAITKDAAALNTLENLRQDADPEVRSTAAVALRHYEANTAVPVLAKFLEDSDFNVRGAAIMMLAEFKDSSEATALLGQLLDSEDSQTRGIASFSLKRMQTPEAKNILEQFLLESNADPIGESQLRTQCSNHLKQIGVGLYNYHETHGRFPPAIGYGPDGKTPHSWRVAILPFLGQAELYKQYDFSESWDGPNNLKLLASMPAVYRCPKVDGDSTNSSYFVLTGPTTVFSGGEGTSKHEITDGTRGTLLVVEAVREIPWTKPEDIPYDPAEPLPKLGGLHDGGSYASFADGSVRWIGDTTSEKDLRALCTKGGKESE